MIIHVSHPTRVTRHVTPSHRRPEGGNLGQVPPWNLKLMTSYAVHAPGRLCKSNMQVCTRGFFVDGSFATSVVNISTVHC